MKKSLLAMIVATVLLGVFAGVSVAEPDKSYTVNTESNAWKTLKTHDEMIGTFRTELTATEDSVCNEQEIKEISDILLAYFNVIDDKMLEKIKRDQLSEKIYRLLLERIGAFERMEKRIGCTFEKISQVGVVDNIEKLTEEEMKASVYVITRVIYSYDDMQESDEFFIFGVWHEVKLEKKKDFWCVSEDVYDERDVTGIASYEDYPVVEVSNDNELAASTLELPDESSYETRASSVNFTASNVNSAIRYANQYCGFSSSSRLYNINDGQSGSSVGSTAYYNPSYTPHASADCANFVSQCLYAGGLPTDSLWYYGAWNATWVGASELANYLKTHYSYASVNASYSNVYPGNPVYWDTSHGESNYHQMICVGKNSAGIPVLNGHTTDIYRMPISNYYSSHSMTTIFIATYNCHSVHNSSAGYYYSSSKHYHICGICEYRLSPSNHVIDHVANRCTVCGYSGPFTN